MKSAERLLVLTLAIEDAALAGNPEEIRLLMNQRQAVLDRAGSTPIDPKIALRIDEADKRTLGLLQAETRRLAQSLRAVRARRSKTRPYGNLRTQATIDTSIAA